MKSGDKTGLWARKQGGSNSKEGAQVGKTAVKQGTETNFLNWKKERMGIVSLKDAERCY